MGQYMYAVNDKQKIYVEAYKMKTLVIEEVDSLIDFFDYCYDEKLSVMMLNENQLQELIENFNYQEFKK